MNKEKARKVLKELLVDARDISLSNYIENEGVKNNYLKIKKEKEEALEFVIDSLDELTKLNQHIASLTHYWREKDDKAFKERLQMIEQEYREKGKEDLAEYIRVQYSDCMRWVPM